MGAPVSALTIGSLLREWRERRRLSQLDLALEAGVSARHLSFVETGRSRPSRELLLDLAEHLDVPLRERNGLLLAAGFAPLYRETPLDRPEMAPVREALDRLLAGHEPFPSIVVDHHWELIAGNRPAMMLMSEGVSSELLTLPINALRLTLHPDGLAGRIVNLAEYSGHILEELRRQATSVADAFLLELERELRSYPGVGIGTPDTPLLPFIPMVLRTANGTELSFFNTLTTFGTALDITIAEMTIESLFPADEATAAALREGWS